MKILTRDLIDSSLNWAVGHSLGAETKDHTFGIEGSPKFTNCTVFPDGRAFTAFRPSTDWSHGGPIIEKRVDSLHTWNDGTWEATVLVNRIEGIGGQGPTPLVAAMRALVASELGDEVDVPDELCIESRKAS